MQCTEITQTRGESVLLTPTSNENTVKDQYDENQQRECKKFLAEFPNLFSKSEHDIGRINLVEQTIDTCNFKPFRLSPYRVPFAKRKTAEIKIATIAERGIIEPAQSPWSSPTSILMMTKTDGSIRFAATIGS